ncbi:aminotransferase class IV [Flammeovirga yaeyamensis]|uniref:branched-chain-amino-acid transaminase n=1 Tax=Flammeovirga yaeyamensis TaxID=367791 RepID=A0AAX1NCD2_9BACT|nr:MULTISPECIES: aminotransferase class IV [Flammeovirga]ANQ49216.1 aminotransferase IV [Flammeovirga sp. MY04]MBB3697921.1 branched-subunit amino acid aminotransferase/4-amino-4-deoxychorismate lyase [Flammeovirga yaeyamensis]NMF35724.1 aminotransferase IV [Flammeovirga yaeyamensis]QWG03323.1 aminotransferase class IV [Flammeovirga yaeyamensis]
MNYILLNKEIIKTNKTNLPITDRGFQFGDGLFETMITKDGNIRFLEDHLERISKGLKELQINVLDDLLTPEYIREQYKTLKKKNGIEGESRIKLIVWRSGGGLYTPLSKMGHVALLTQEYQQKRETKNLKVDFAETVNVAPTPVSSCKTLSSLTYTLAGLEKQKRKLDDVILLNNEGYLAETISGNLFWVKNKVVFTPKISVGCVSGISRKNIIADLESKGYKVKRVFARKADIIDADAVLTTNVTGVSLITQIGEHNYKCLDAWRKVFETVYHY